jgi:hypothetical protein
MDNFTAIQRTIEYTVLMEYYFYGYHIFRLSRRYNREQTKFSYAEKAAFLDDIMTAGAYASMKSNCITMHEVWSNV